MPKCYPVTLLRTSLFVIGSFVLLGCANKPPHSPAPVVSLDMTTPSETNPFDQALYTIQPGDTLFAIAWYSGNDYRDLARINNISPPYTIKAGAQLRLTPVPIKPQASSEPSSGSTSSSKSGRTSSKTEQGVIDRPTEQAYGESEKNVKRQQVSSNRRAGAGTDSDVSTRTAPQQFSQTIEQWVWPATGEIIGTFDKAESGNKGIDIRNTRGTPIVAAADGKVVYTGQALRGYGRLVIIKHTETFLSAYAHNDRILVNEQQWVKAGEQIGTMGSSGTDSVMLHFEVRYRGRSLDPQRYLPRQ